MPKINKLKKPIIVRKIVGHSMLPILPPGTTVYAVQWFVRPQAGKVVIIEHEGKEKIKRIQDVKENEIFVVGDYATSSTDSKDFGWINIRLIKAIVIWPTVKKTD